MLVNTTSSDSTPCLQSNSVPSSYEWPSEYLDSPSLNEALTQVPEWISSVPDIHALTLKSWHRMSPQNIPPEKLSPFLGFAPI